MISPGSNNRTSESPGWWLYLLTCSDGRTYAGIALDVEARFDTHAAGRGSKFTRANRPTAILGAQIFATRSAALKAEYALKQLDRSAKLAWANQHRYHYPQLLEQESGTPR